MDLRQKAIEAYEEYRAREIERAFKEREWGRSKIAADLAIPIETVHATGDDAYTIDDIDLTFFIRKIDQVYSRPNNGNTWEMFAGNLKTLGRAILRAEHIEDETPPPLVRYGKIGVWEQATETRPYKVLNTFGDSEGNAYLIVEFTDIEP